MGIFWVARQELPVFDLHYLLGYVTLALAMLHVALHWSSLAGLMRRSTWKAKEGQSGVGTVRRRRLVWLLTLGLAGLAGYGLGFNAGTEEVEVKVGVVPAGDDNQPGSRGGGGKVRRVMVRDESGQDQLLAHYYHSRTRHSRRGVLSGAMLDLSSRPETFKAYPGKPTILLPRQQLEVAMPTGRSIQARRTAPHGIRPDAITLAQLATVLHFTNGVTRTVRRPGGDLLLRAAPSAGALYPTDTYVLAARVEGLVPGLYHYGVKEHLLHQIRSGTGLAREMAALVEHPSQVKDAPAVLLFSSVFRRTTWKYRARAWRYCLLDAGHLMVQAALTASALGLISRPMAAFDDQRVNALISLDETREGVLAILPVGKPTGGADSSPRLRFKSAPRKLQLSGVPDLVSLAQGMTSLSLDGQASSVEVISGSGQGPVAAPGTLISLGRTSMSGAALGPTIQRRRSIRRFSHRPLTRGQLSSMVLHAFGRSGAPPLPDPGIRGGRRLSLYLSIHGVKGISQGVYAYHADSHSISLVRSESGLRGAFTAASLHQDLVGGAAVLFILTLDPGRLGVPDGDRGYRHAALEAGMVGGQVYLQATALGLGCTGIGAFFDDEIMRLIGANRKRDQVLYLLAVGAPAE